MVQVTIEWEGSEIGYGEGESETYARREAIDSVETIYWDCECDWQFSVVRS